MQEFVLLEVGSLSNDNNYWQQWKQNVSFETYNHVYLDPFDWSNEGNFS